MQQTLLAIISGKGMGFLDPTQQMQPTVAETLRAIENSADSSAMELLQHQPEFVHINSSQDAARAEEDYAKVCLSLLVKLFSFANPCLFYS